MVFKKDETPYFVFSCLKCGQYQYVKTEKERKKCPKCHKTVLLSTINTSTVAKGMTEALNLVRQNQYVRSINESKGDMGFSTPNDISLTIYKAGSEKIFEKKPKDKKKIEMEEEYDSEFKGLLLKINESYDKFPYYLIKGLLEEFKIPEPQLKLLIPKFISKGILIRMSGNYFKIDNFPLVA